MRNQDISTNKTGFQNLEYSLTALPVLAYLKLDGIAEDGVQWERPQPSVLEKGADGKAKVVQKPVVYACTIALMPNSNSRLALDNLCDATQAKYGRRLVDYAMVLNVSNYTTGVKTVYSGGTIEEYDGGDSATRDDGQGNKVYRLSFADRISMPL